MSTMTAQDLLAAHPFLSGLSGERLGRLSTWARRTPFHSGARVFSEGIADLITSSCFERNELPGT